MKPTPRLTILYEDSMRRGSGRFPLHDLVLWMVVDDLPELPYWEVARAVRGWPLRGVDNVLKALPAAARRAAPGRLFLLLDADRVRHHVGLAPDADEEAVVARIRARAAAPGLAGAFFLHPNLEGLIRAIGTADPGISRVSVERALQKRLNDRDLVLAACRGPERHLLRAGLRRAQPGLDALVRALAARLQAGDPASP